MLCRYDAVAKLGIASAKQHLQATFPDGIALETAFVSPAVVHQLMAAAEDAGATNFSSMPFDFLNPACILCRYDTVAKLGVASAKQHLQATFQIALP